MTEAGAPEARGGESRTHAPASLTVALIWIYIAYSVALILALLVLLGFRIAAA